MKSKFIITLLLMIGLILYFIYPKLLRLFPLGPGVCDFSKNIVNGYELNRTSPDQIFVVPHDGWNDEVAIIPSKVLKINHYRNYILAERQGLKKRNIDDTLSSNEVHEEKIIDYWILDTENNLVLKNLTYKRYQGKMDSLKIPKNTKLIDVYNY